MTAKTFTSVYNNQLTITEIEQGKANTNGDEQRTNKNNHYNTSNDPYWGSCIDVQFRQPLLQVSIVV